MDLKYNLGERLKEKTRYFKPDDSPADNVDANFKKIENEMLLAIGEPFFESFLAAVFFLTSGRDTAAPRPGRPTTATTPCAAYKPPRAPYSPAPATDGAPQRSKE